MQLSHFMKRYLFFSETVTFNVIRRALCLLYLLSQGIAAKYLDYKDNSAFSSFEPTKGKTLFI